MCYMCNYANKNQEQTQIESLPDTTMNGRRLKSTRILVCKCQYLSVTFANILNGIKIVEKCKTRKNQQTFLKCNMCNITIKITL